MNTINQLEDVLEEFLRLKNYPSAILTEPISKGKWSIREILGHLLYWDKFNLEKMVPLMTDGVKLPPFPNHDSHNEEAISYIDKYESVGDIIDHFVKTRKELVKELRKINQDIKFNIKNEPMQFSIKDFVEIFLEHDFHHLNQIREKLTN